MNPNSYYSKRNGWYRFSRSIRASEIIALAEAILERRVHRGPVLSSPEQTRQYLVLKLAELEREVFTCLFLDTKHRVIAFETLFYGTIDGASVHPREVVKRALELNAAAVIVAHNHPSGVAEPSRADESLTRRIQEALALVDIRLLDHFVIGDTEATSFAERGLL